MKMEPLQATEMHPGFISWYSIGFSVKKQFRGKRQIFYYLWDFMWRVF